MSPGRRWRRPGRPSDQIRVAGVAPAPERDEPAPRQKLLPTGAFLRLVLEYLPTYLSDGRRDYRAQVRGSLLQVHFGNPKLHFEVWPHGRTGLTEIGLHFEAARELNERLRDRFDRALVPIKAALGDRVDAEEWDFGWARVYETLPTATLDGSFAETIAARLARHIETLQPNLEEFLPSG